MLKSNSQITFVVALLRSLDSTILGALLTVIWRILASLRGFSRRELNPQSFQSLELRLERFARELARVLLQYALNHAEASSKPRPIHWEQRTYLPAFRQSRTIETRFGTVCFRRWLYQNEWFFVRDVAAMDLRLGLVDNRVSPALAHKLGRLAADLPQQPAIQQLAEQFDVHGSGVGEWTSFMPVSTSANWQIHFLVWAGCKVIFNQRMKQSGMRWSKGGGQWVVDLRTACRSRLWDKIWNRYLSTIDQPTAISQPKPENELVAA
ncbi:MAG: hypothetical protein ABL921_31620 [Pirellula sp.]